jgi:hypothetical protein
MVEMILFMPRKVLFCARRMWMVFVKIIKKKEKIIKKGGNG